MKNKNINYYNNKKMNYHLFLLIIKNKYFLILEIKSMIKC